MLGIQITIMLCEIVCIFLDQHRNGTESGFMAGNTHLASKTRHPRAAVRSPMLFGGIATLSVTSSGQGMSM